jgi:acetaldehyde dehydrogenase/alcohol dehydrogenase
MSVEAFDDQCTGANPRLPRVSELKQLFIDAHYGNKIQSIDAQDKSNEKK